MNRTPVKVDVEVMCQTDALGNIEFAVSVDGFQVADENLGVAFRAAYEVYLHHLAAEAAEVE